MKIRNIQVSSDKTCVYVSADCTIRRSGHDTVYFKLDKTYQDFIYQDASPFAAALVFPAMKLGEDLLIEGSISERLYHGMQNMMQPKVLKGLGLQRISIHPDRLTKDTHNPTQVGSFFSGGVDSFYTYLQHKKDKDAITHFIFVHGFDIDLINKELWNTARTIIEKIAEKGWKHQSNYS